MAELKKDEFSPETESEAVKLIRSYLPEFLRNKPFYEIANYRDESGSYTGVSAIRDAWKAAQTFAASGAPAYYPQLRETLLKIASLSSGSGTYDNQLQNFMVGFDKYGKSMLMPNIEMQGLTFFTRPRLCLQSSNLRSNPVMLPLDTSNPNNIAFAIRYLLDTNLCNENFKNHLKYQEAANNCPLINPESPWLIPLTNALGSLSGLPDYDLTTENTAGGYFSESQKYAIGADNFSTAGYSISCDFRELPGGILSALFFYWLEYIRCVTRGDMLAYADDIDGLILNYTVSIYTFNMDPSMQYITKWAKCTGCFPKSLNIGSVLNKSSNEGVATSAQRISVSFECNKIEYMKPECLMDFNTLATRYCSEINKMADENGRYNKSAKTDLLDKGNPVVLQGLQRPGIPDSPFANFCGLPFIVSDPNGYRLIYRQSKRDLFSDPVIRKLIACDIARTSAEWLPPEGLGRYESNYDLYQQYDYNDFYNTDVKHMLNCAQNPKANPFAFDTIIDRISDGTFFDEIKNYKPEQ